MWNPVKFVPSGNPVYVASKMTSALVTVPLGIRDARTVTAPNALAFRPGNRRDFVIRAHQAHQHDLLGRHQLPADFTARRALGVHIHVEPCRIGQDLLDQRSGRL